MARESSPSTACKLFVRGLADEVDHDVLSRAFSKYGRVVNVFIAHEKDAPTHRGFGFVTFETPSHRDQAMKGMHNKELHGKTLYVEAAVPERVRGPVRGSRGGRGSRADDRGNGGRGDGPFQRNGRFDDRPPRGGNRDFRDSYPPSRPNYDLRSPRDGFAGGRSFTSTVGRDLFDPAPAGRRYQQDSPREYMTDRRAHTNGRYDADRLRAYDLAIRRELDAGPRREFDVLASRRELDMPRSREFDMLGTSRIYDTAARYGVDRGNTSRSYLSARNAYDPPDSHFERGRRPLASMSAATYRDERPLRRTSPLAPMPISRSGALSRPSAMLSRPSTAMARSLMAMSRPSATMSRLSGATSRLSAATARSSRAMLRPTAGATRSSGVMSRPVAAVARSSGLTSRPAGIMSRPSWLMSRPAVAMARPLGAMSRPSAAMSRPSAAMSRPSAALSRSAGVPPRSLPLAARKLTRPISPAPRRAAVLGKRALPVTSATPRPAVATRPMALRRSASPPEKRVKVATADRRPRDTNIGKRF